MIYRKALLHFYRGPLLFSISNLKYKNYLFVIIILGCLLEAKVLSGEDSHIWWMLTIASYHQTSELHHPFQPGCT